MKNIFCTTLLLLSLFCFSQKQETVSPEAEAFYNKALPVIKPAYKNLVSQTAKQLRNRRVNADSLFNALKTNSILGSLNGGDIEAVCFLVLMQASKDAGEDLKTIMDGVENINKQKDAQRKNMQAISHPNNTLSKNENTIQSNPKLAPVKKDSLSNLSEMQQIRLQMAMDRRSKLISTISNIMKKISDTQNQILQNLK